MKDSFGHYKTSSELVFDLIFDSIGVRLTPQLFDVLDPYPILKATDDTVSAQNICPNIAGLVRNTGATLKRKEALGQDPDQTEVYYRKLDLNIIEVDLTHPIVIGALPVSTHEILEELNVNLKTNFTADDLENLIYYRASDFKLVAAKGSVAWSGELILEVQVGPLDLSAVLVDTELNGFQPSNDLD